MDRLTDRILALCPAARTDIDFMVYAAPLDGGGYDETIVRWDVAVLGKRPSATVLGKVVLAAAPTSAARMTSLQFMALFTDAEQLQIVGATMTDAPTKLWYDRMLAADYIDLSNAQTTAGLQALVDSGLLASARRDRVLTGLSPEG